VLASRRLLYLPTHRNLAAYHGAKSNNSLQRLRRWVAYFRERSLLIKEPLRSSPEQDRLTRMHLLNIPRLSFLLVLIAIPIGALAQHPAISSPFLYDAKTQVFRIETTKSTYAFGVNAHGELQSIYWGGRLLESDPLPRRAQ